MQIGLHGFYFKEIQGPKNLKNKGIRRGHLIDQMILIQLKKTRVDLFDH